jgi:hypothetical protein
MAGAVAIGKENYKYNCIFLHKNWKNIFICEFWLLYFILITQSFFHLLNITYNYASDTVQTALFYKDLSS